MKYQAFVGGRIWTAGYWSSRPLDVLVADDRIVEVSRAGELDAQDAEVIDLGGQLLIPGFQDAHVHLGMGGADLRACNLLGLQTRREVEAAISAYAVERPETAWIVGGGWQQNLFVEPPTRQLLDRLVGGRRAVLYAHTRHAAWASSAAFEAAGIDEHTPDPVGGWIERDESGRPSGMLYEQAMDLLRSALPETDEGQRKQNLLAAQDELLKLGITSVQDALVGTGLGGPDYHGAYRALLREDRLRLRVTAALWWDIGRGVEQIPELIERRKALEAEAGSRRIIADTVKIMVDGAHLIFMEREPLFEATLALDAEGFTAHYHSYGEASTRNVLDAIEAARRAHPASRGRHHIAHLMVVAPEEFARFAPLGVTANIQGFWSDRPVMHEMLRPSRLSHDAHRREYPFARLVAEGTRLAGGSDWPVSSADPLDAVRVATMRPVRGGTALDELDRLDIPSVLKAYTAGAAHVNGRTGVTGRIAPGFLADFAVLDRDILSGGSDAARASVDQTWVGGTRLV